MSDDYDPGEDPALDVLINRLPPETAERMRRWVAARRAEQREQGRLFHQQLTLVFGTLGAIAFAGLVLVLQDPKPFRLNGPKWLTPHQNFVVLVIILSIAIMLALFSCIATTFSAAGATKMLGPVGTFGYVGGLLSVVALLISMLLMV
ncbi:MAG: hypothetical protein JRM86_01365, partial [Nitrososphaerota archaeon]|nr:hypothetical protein [Nitrososphaerota archaeon]